METSNKNCRNEKKKTTQLTYILVHVLSICIRGAQNGRRQTGDDVTVTNKLLSPVVSWYPIQDTRARGTLCLTRPSGSTRRIFSSPERRCVWLLFFIFIITTMPCWYCARLSCLVTSCLVHSHSRSARDSAAAFRPHNTTLNIEITMRLPL